MKSSRAPYHAPMSPRRSRWIDAALALALAAVTFLLYRKILRLWWMFDDPIQLNMLAAYRARDFLFSSGFWRDRNIPVFTPLLLVSLAADKAMFGLRAEGFYAHQLVAALGIGPLLYALLRLWFSRPISFFAALIAILGTPMIQITQLLMCRHYVEGLLLATAAAIAYVMAARRDRFGLGAVSAVLALVAMLAKEVFVPLPLVLAMLPEPRRRKLFVPQAVALAIYAIWRMRMLGPELRGYGWTVRGAEWVRIVTTLPLRALRILAADSAAGWIVIVMLLVLLAIAFVRDRASRLPLAIAFLCAVLPVVPVSIELQPRFALATWLVLAIAAAVAAAATPRRIGIAALAVLAIAATIANRTAWAKADRDARRMSDEARVFSMLAPDELLFAPMAQPTVFVELRILLGAQGRWSYVELPLCGRKPPRRLFTYDAASRAVKETSFATIERRCAAIRAMPITATFETDRDGALFWHLGPYRDGRYSFLLTPDGSQVFDVPADGGYRLPKMAAIDIRVRYESPAGWVTYSPERRVPLRQGQP
jgi:hypothetical protein